MNICPNHFESGTEQQIWKHFLITERKWGKMSKRVKKKKKNLRQVSSMNDSLVKIR